MVSKMRSDCSCRNCVLLFYGIFIVLMEVALKSTGMGQVSMESERLNEIFDDTYPVFAVPSSPAKSNLTAFLLSYSKSHFSDKITSKGLDITSPEIFESKTGAQLYAVFPGTIWCGVGNLAGNSQTLGFFANTDSCCRTHDKCQVTIPPDSSRFGLKNTGYFTRSHCNCDEKFYFCLKRAGSIVANKVGFTYFNILRPQCFRKEFPIAACLRWYGGRCLTYVVDQSDPREWQWFDNRQF